VLRLLAVYTLLWLAIYIPGETSVTISIAGVRGLLYGAYIMNALGMMMLLWGAASGLKGRANAAAILAVAWSWTAATMWRATADRFWYASLGRGLYFGNSELWAAPIVTALAVIPMIASMRLAFRRPSDT
jgi:hypothetical protein